MAEKKPKKHKKEEGYKANASDVAQSVSNTDAPRRTPPSSPVQLKSSGSSKIDEGLKEEGHIQPKAFMIASADGPPSEDLTEEKSPFTSHAGAPAIQRQELEEEEAAQGKFMPKAKSSSIKPTSKSLQAFQPIQKKDAPRKGGPTKQSVQTQGGTQTIQRVRGKSNPTKTKTKTDLLGTGGPGSSGITVSDFSSYFRVQADWFSEPTLTKADRIKLWQVVHNITNKSYYLSGAGDLKLKDVIALSPTKALHLDTFCRGAGGAQTVRIHNTSTYDLAKRIKIGHYLLMMESFIKPAVLAVTVSESQLLDVITNNLIGHSFMYFTQFKPTLQYSYDSSKAGGKGPEFERVLNLVRGNKYTDYYGLKPYIRNLHRFSIGTLDRLKANYGVSGNKKPVQLVIMSPHDSTGAFQSDESKLEDLVHSSTHLVLIVEGAASLTGLTSLIPVLAAKYGVKGKIAQVMLSGHGENRHMSMAGAGNPTVSGNTVSYNDDGLDLNKKNPKKRAETIAFFDALLHNMDPAAAKIVFNGCLVGSNKVPDNIAPKDIPKYVKDNPSLATFVNDRAKKHFKDPTKNFVQAPMASISTPDSFTKVARKGGLDFQYSSDKHAFGGNEAKYVEHGKEPEGLLFAAVQVAAKDKKLAAKLLRIRAGKAVNDWDDTCCVIAAELAIKGVPVGGSVKIGRLTKLAHMISTPYGSGWGISQVSTWLFAYKVNKHKTLAAEIYAKFAALTEYTSPSDSDFKEMVLMMEQGRIHLGQARQANLVSFISANASLTTFNLEKVIELDPRFSKLNSADFFKSTTTVNNGNTKLALAWHHLNPADANVKIYLNKLVTSSGGVFKLNVPSAILGSKKQIDILRALNKLGPSSGGSGSSSKPLANVDVNKNKINDHLVTGDPFKGEVDNASWVNIRKQPFMTKKNKIKAVKKGTVLNAMGFSGSWVAVDYKGKLGFIYKRYVKKIS